MTMENDLVELIRSRVDNTFDGEAEFTELEVETIADCIEEQQAQVAALQAERASLIATKHARLAAKDARIQTLEAELAKTQERLATAYQAKARCNDDANWERKRANAAEAELARKTEVLGKAFRAITYPADTSIEPTGYGLRHDPDSVAYAAELLIAALVLEEKTDV